MSYSGIHHLTEKCDTLTYTLKGIFSLFFPINMTQKWAHEHVMVIFAFYTDRAVFGV